MLTPLDFKKIYHENVHRVDILQDARIQYRQHLCNVTESDSLTTEQWNNLVKVCAIIKSNSERFYMAHWHTPYHIVNECGTTHCIAGWAASLAANDTNLRTMDNYFYAELLGKTPEEVESIRMKFEDEYINPVSYIAQRMLSNYVSPFFYWTRGVYDSGETAEQVIMDCFIDAVLAEAEAESNEILEEFNRTISSFERQLTCA